MYVCVYMHINMYACVRAISVCYMYISTYACNVYVCANILMNTCTYVPIPVAARSKE